MLTRKKPLNRKTPLRAKRWGIPRKKRILARALEKRSDDTQYFRNKLEYLRDHPLCQVCMAYHRISEADAIAIWSTCPWNSGVWIYKNDGSKIFIPKAGEVHHRNKKHTRKRLLDKRYWMAVSRAWHTWLENKKDEARSIGILCKIQTDEDGYLPDGSRYLFTPDLLTVRTRGGNEVSQ